VCSVHDAFNILGAFTHCRQLLVQALRSLDSSLGMELGWTTLAHTDKR
jgi:hypothetical protein